MSEDFDGLGKGWLRERARTLRTAARDVEKAYTRGPMFRICKQVSYAYREAADVLERAAIEWTDPGEVE